VHAGRKKKKRTNLIFKGEGSIQPRKGEIQAKENFSI